MSDPQAVRAALGFQQQLQAADAKTIEAMARRWGAVESSLTATIETLADEIAEMSASGETVPAWKIYELERYQSLVAQIGAELSKFMQWAIVQLGDEATKAQMMARAHAAEMLGMQTGAGAAAKLDTALDKLGTDAAEKITGLAQGGQPLDKILNSAYPTAVTNLTNKLITGAALGWNPRKTAAEMLRNGGLDSAFNHILLVARDQQIRNYREAQRDAYRASNVVYGYKRLAAKNKRTCMACLALDGTIYPTGQVMELHPQDRCTMIPLIVGRPVPEWQTGKEFFKRLSPADQREMLGPAKYNAWKDGLFELDQIVSLKPNQTWGTNAQVTPLKTLLQGGGGLGDVARVSATDLLKLHQTAVPTTKAKTVDLGENTALISELKKLLPQTQLPLKVKTGISNVLKAAEAGDSAYTYTDEVGKLTGAVSWATKQDNQFYTEVTAAGFADEATNRKALIDVAQVAQAQGRGVLVNVPKDLTARYLDWGFTVTKPGEFTNTMQIAGDEIKNFIQSPETFGAAKKVQVIQDAEKKLNDPQGTAVFRSGYELPGVGGYKPTTLDAAEIPALKKKLADSEPLQVPEGKHAAAGIILIDPKTNKLVLVNPAGGFGGAKTTVPKGTVEAGEDLQETAIREVFEETGFKPKIIGLLGDYEKSTSANRLYIGTIEDGAPWAGHFETEAVQLVPIEDARKFVDTGVDKTILKDFEELYKRALEKGDGNLEKGLDLIAAEKEASAKVLKVAQVDALTKYLDGDPVTIDELKLAKGAGTLNQAKAIDAEIGAKETAEKEAATKAAAEAKKAKNIFDGLMIFGPDAMDAVPINDLRTAVTWAYETGQNPRDIADLEAILAIRKEQAILKEPVPLPDTLQGAGKEELIKHLVRETGATPWKLKQLTKPQVEGLFGQSKVNILQAAEDGAAKYYAAKTAKITPAVEPEQQSGVILPPSLHGASKAKLVDFLTEQTGVAKWKINQLGKGEIDALFGKTKEDILAAGEQGAAKYYQAKGQKKPEATTPADKAIEAEVEKVFTADLAKEMGKNPQVAAAWLRLPPSTLQGVKPVDLIGMTKAQAVEFIQNTAGKQTLAMSTFSAWLDKPDSLKTMTTADLEAIDQFLTTVEQPNQAFARAVKAAVQEKKVPPPEQPEVVTQPRPEVDQVPDPIQKGKELYELMKTGQIPNGTLDSVAKIGVQGAKDLLAYLKESDNLSEGGLQFWGNYIKAIDDLKLPASVDPQKATKTYLAKFIADGLGTTPGTNPAATFTILSKKTKAEILQFLQIGTPEITAPKPKAAAPPIPAQPTAAAPALKLNTGTLDITGAKPELISDLHNKAAAVWQGKALEGATKALNNIQAGAKGLVYTDAGGNLLGVVAMQNVGSALKVTGAALANADVNAQAVADGLKEAAKLGLPLETWVPEIVKAQYLTWGFKNTTSNYYALSAADAPPELTKHASRTITPQTDKGPIPLPPNVATVEGAKALSKAELVAHISLHGNIPKAKLDKLDKSDLVSLIGQQVGSKIDNLIAQKEQEAVLVTAYSKWKTNGNQVVKTTKEGNKILEYFQVKGTAGTPVSDIDALRVHIEKLAQEEREASPFTPRFTPRPLPPLPDTAKLPQHKDFPADVNKLEVVKKLGGSTGAELVKAPDGRLFVRKKGANEGHLREEVYADSVYQAAGANVPKHQIYETPSGPVKLAEYVPGKSLADFLQTATPNERARVLSELRSNFALDALMTNRDVLGLAQDNVIIGEDGKVWRIDNGGSLRYRAMGDVKKGSDWDGYPVDIWSMRESGRGGAAENNARIFGDLDIYDITDQARELLTRRDEMLAAVPQEVRSILHQRLESLRDMVEVSDMFRKDKFEAEYSDGFLREATRIKQAGLIDALPKKMRQTEKGGVQVKDEKGQLFDNWRGKGSHMEAIGQYMKAHGGNLNMIAEWMAAQARDSWNSEPQAFKYHRALTRNSFDDYYWRNGVGGAKKSYDAMRKKYGPEVFDRTMAIWHAFTFESLRKMDFPHNNPEGGYVEIARTENRSVVELYGLKQSLTDAQKFQRGAAESGSIYDTVTVHGDQLTLQRVPWHRIHGFYFQGRGLMDTGAFLGDSENEFVFDGAGLDVFYVGSVHSGTLDKLWNKLDD